MKNTILILFLISVVSCKKEQPEPPKIADEYAKGLLVLNEGLFEQNNASITYYGAKQTYQQVFKSENSRGLGDTANDFETYTWQGKDYIIIAVDVSSQVEIIERYTLKSIAQIPLFDGVSAREPRRVKVKGDNAYVCNFDGTIAVIDLNTNAVSDIIEVGANPDGMAIVDDRLFVSNSGGLLYPVYDSTITVINTITNTVETTFKTRINSASMVVDSENEIYLISRGNYGDISPALVRIDANTYTVLDIMEMPITSMSLKEKWLYFYDSDMKVIRTYNTLTEEIHPDIVLDLADYTTFYGFQVDLNDNTIYCIDANGYVNSATIKAYSLTGSFLYEFQAGLNANKIIRND